MAAPTQKQSHLWVLNLQPHAAAITVTALVLQAQALFLLCGKRRRHLIVALAALAAAAGGGGGGEWGAARRLLLTGLLCGCMPMPARAWTAVRRAEGCKVPRLHVGALQGSLPGGRPSKPAGACC